MEIGRIRAVIDRCGQRFIDRVFTAGEIEYCTKRRDGAKHFAARFAVKEAVYKCLRRERQAPLRWKDIEIILDDGGLPSVRLHGGLLEEQEQSGISRIEISLTHSEGVAAAVAIAIRER